MGNGRSSLLGHQPMQVNIFHHGHHDGDKYKDKEAERKMGPVHVVGTVTSSEELLQAPFGRQRGVATQVSIYKNDGYVSGARSSFPFPDCTAATRDDDAAASPRPPPRDG